VSAAEPTEQDKAPPFGGVFYRLTTRIERDFPASVLHFRRPVITPLDHLRQKVTLSPPQEGNLKPCRAAGSAGFRPQFQSLMSQPQSWSERIQ